jgi:prevent-host-death family protein
MKMARIAELKNHLSRYVAYVKQGGQVLVMERDRPVAKLVPLAIAPDMGAESGRAARLEQQGLVRRGTGGAPEWLGRRKPARVKGSVLADLLAERAEGR